LKTSIMKRMLSVALASFVGLCAQGTVFAKEPLVIAASPSLSVPLEALGRAFETTHPDVKVMLYFDDGLDIRERLPKFALDCEVDGDGAPCHGVLSPRAS